MGFIGKLEGLPGPREKLTNPQEIFCPNMDCLARGQTGKGNIHIYSQKDQRYRCEGGAVFGFEL